MSSFHNTIATLARCKKPLTHFVEFVELKKQVAGLQKSDGHHNKEERETKDSIEYLTNQVHALSEAFRVLSGVVVEEVDGLKKELRSQKQDIKAVAKAHTSQMQWTTSVQREMSDLRASIEKDLTEEGIASMKRAAKHDARLDGLASKVEEVEAQVEGVRAAHVDAGAQRVDDLELMQAALEAAQRNHRRLDAECKALTLRAQKAEDALRQLSSGLQQHQVETKQAIVENVAYNQNLGETVTVLKHALANGVVLGGVGGGGGGLGFGDSVPVSPMRGTGGGGAGGGGAAAGATATVTATPGRGGAPGGGSSRFATPVKGGMTAGTGLGELSPAAERFLRH